MSIEVMKQALVALCSANPIGHALEDYEYHNKATEALRQAIKQAEYDNLTTKFGERAKEYLEEQKKSWKQEPMAVLKVCDEKEQKHVLMNYYLTPPSKPWVRLTDEEIDDAWLSLAILSNKGLVELRNDYARAIEAKLKEKNT